jgi:hypothetical protein
VCVSEESMFDVREKNRCLMCERMSEFAFFDVRDNVTVDCAGIQCLLMCETILIARDATGGLIHAACGFLQPWKPNQVLRT